VAGAKLPELKRGDVDRFLSHFAPDHKRVGFIVTGEGRGSAFTIHLRHDGGLRPDQLSRALGYMGIERAEFMGWYRS
jgi:hypothetical protein